MYSANQIMLFRITIVKVVSDSQFMHVIPPVFFSFKVLRLSMPLLHRKKFTVNPLPSDIQPDKDYFVCDATKEVFTDYE